jgi:predicted DNA-binding protein
MHRKVKKMSKKRLVAENIVVFHTRMPAETKEKLDLYADKMGESAARVLSNLVDQHLPSAKPAVTFTENDDQVDLETWLRNHE